MDLLLTIGLLLIIGYVAGWLLDKLGLPKIVGYILTGILFSPNTTDWVHEGIIDTTHPLLEICLAFIAFEVGGALKWSKIRKHEKEIVSITLLASFLPLMIIAGGVFTLGYFFPEVLAVEGANLIILALTLGALASPTEPAATLAVMHQYKARGKVSDTILGVAALDDVLGILLFSLVLAVVYLLTGSEANVTANPMVDTLYEILVGVTLGLVIGSMMRPLANLLDIDGEGQWVVLIFALIILCVGMAHLLCVDMLLSTMTMGIMVVNRDPHQKMIFNLLQRYTEDLIFLFFFLLSGLHLDVSSIPEAMVLIVFFVLLRTVGKYLGTVIGASSVHADRNIRRYTAGGLLPQGGIVIGLVLSIFDEQAFSGISELLLTTVMGAMVVHELLGPLAAKYSLKKAGEISERSGK